MTGETVECFNCGHANPAWAQVCRNCGVPLRPGVAHTAPSGSEIAQSSATPAATPVPAPTATPVPTPVPLPGTLAFGTGVDGAGNLTGKTNTFAPGSTFAHLLTNSAAFGTNQIGEGVIQIAADGKESKVVDPAQNTLPVSPTAKKAVFGPISTDQLRNALGGPGKYRMEVYLGKTKIAQGVFTLTGG